MEGVGDNYKDFEKRNHSALKIKFGKENFERLNDFCSTEFYVTHESFGDKKTSEIATKIMGKGLVFLEEYRRERTKFLTSIFSIGASILLVILTGIYVANTQDLNDITYKQFEATNRPYLYLSFPEKIEISDNKKDINTLALLENLGKAPGRIYKISILFDGKEKPIREFDVSPTIKQDEGKTLNLTIGNYPKDGFDLVAFYTGIGEYSKNLWNYSVTFNISKEGDIILDEWPIS